MPENATVSAQQITAAELCLWQYLSSYQPPALLPVTWAIGLGCADLRVAQCAAQLIQQGFANRLLFSGGYGRLTRQHFQQTEAEIFAAEAVRLGVPASSIVLETNASNTQENIRNSFVLLPPADLSAGVTLVCRTIFRPRVAAVMALQNAQQDFQLVSPELTYAQYAANADEQHLARHMMVGEIDRLLHYPARGWQAKLEIPSIVIAAYEILIRAGYQHYLVTPATSI